MNVDGKSKRKQKHVVFTLMYKHRAVLSLTKIWTY